MIASVAQQLPASSIVVPGQLTLRTIHGRNGPFKVGRLVTPIGKFVVKDAELEQYPEGKYNGEFIIRYIDSKAYPTCDGMRFEIRASLDGMTLSGIDKLSKAEAHAFATLEVDPLDEELATQPLTPAAMPAPASVPVRASTDPLIDTRPFSVDAPPATGAASSSPDSDDAALFGLLWPLGESVKLDSTIDRRTLRLQIARLGVLGYALDFKSQQWNRQPDHQAA
ncbi:DUF3275 family protein [Pseudomonas aeruginosa]|uniref:DUF3275 family protein n=1 Tax=Pseudomonas aeruginosa TaxID=287 RepID=UPI003D9C5894